MTKWNLSEGIVRWLKVMEKLCFGLFCIGAVWLLIALYVECSFVAQSAKTTGRVVGYEAHSVIEGQRYYVRTIEYSVADSVYTQRESYAKPYRDFPKHDLTVLYSPASPEKFKPDDFLYLYFFSFCGGIIVFTSYFFLIAMRYGIAKSDPSSKKRSIFSPF